MANEILMSCSVELAVVSVSVTDQARSKIIFG